MTCREGEVETSRLSVGERDPIFTAEMLTLVGTAVPLRPRLRSHHGFIARVEEPLDNQGAPDGRLESVRGSREHDEHIVAAGADGVRVSKQKSAGRP